MPLASVGLVEDVLPAAEIVARLANEASAAIAALPHTLALDS